METRPSSCLVARCLGQLACRSLVTCLRPIHCMGGGSPSQVVRLHSSRRLSRLECWALPRQIRSRRILTMSRQVVCSCASISSVTLAPSMPLWPSTHVPSARGGQATTFMNHLSLVETFLVFGCFL